MNFKRSRSVPFLSELGDRKFFLRGDGGEKFGMVYNTFNPVYPPVHIIIKPKYKVTRKRMGANNPYLGRPFA